MENNRIFVLDILRGFALAGILLVHHIEKFNLYVKPEGMPQWLVSMDAYLWHQVFYFISGKAFALFSMLFGFSYYIMYRNAIGRGEQYFGRHIWRMTLLLGFAGVHVLFFRGDILSLYAILGVFLVGTRYLNNAWLLCLSLILLVNPIFLYSVAQYLFFGESYNWRIPGLGVNFNDYTMNGSFIELAHANLRYGILNELRWSWNVGRVPTIAGLFLLGCYFARIDAFSEKKLGMWYRVLIGALIVWFVVHLIQKVWIPQIDLKFTARLFNGSLKAQINTAMMLSMLSVFILVWNAHKHKLAFTKIASFGRMSLSNYLGMSVIGAVLYYGWGLSLYRYFGATASLMLGVLVLYFQIYLSNIWLVRHKQGPLEYVWRRLTWGRLKFGQ